MNWDDPEESVAERLPDDVGIGNPNIGGNHRPAGGKQPEGQLPSPPAPAACTVPLSAESPHENLAKRERSSPPVPFNGPRLQAAKVDSRHVAWPGSLLL